MNIKFKITLLHCSFSYLLFLKLSVSTSHDIPRPVNNPKVRSKNVLLVMTDDMRPELGSYGNSQAKTPNLDKFAQDSTLFTQAYSQQALCAPSRASLLTSRLPQYTKVFDLKTYWRKSGGNFTTLPQYFKERGYFTYSIGKIFHPGRSSNYTDDYPTSWTSPTFHPSTEKYQHAKTCLDDDGQLRMNAICPVDVETQPEKTLPDIQSTNHALEILENISKSFKESKTSSQQKQPFFLAVGFHKPHLPLKYPKRFKDLYPIENIILAKNRYFPPDLPTVAWNPWLYLQKRDDIKKLNISFPYGYLPHETQKLMIQSYYASISYIDSLFGQLVDKLKELQLYEDTVIVFVSDHGWQLGEHQEWEKFNNFRLTNHVPLIIKMASAGKSDSSNFGRGLVSDVLVELLDLFPTIVDSALGINQKNFKSNNIIPPCQNPGLEILCTQGKSLIPWIIEDENKEILKNMNFVRWQYPRPSFEVRNNSDYPAAKEIAIMGYSIMTINFRYCEWLAYSIKLLGARRFPTLYAKEFYSYPLDYAENSNLFRVSHDAILKKEEFLDITDNGIEQIIGNSSYYKTSITMTNAILPLPLKPFAETKIQYLDSIGSNFTMYHREKKNIEKSEIILQQILLAQHLIQNYF